MTAYVAHYRSGHPAPWSVRSSASECRKAATEGMLSAADFDALLTTSDRWNKLYRQGCRVRKYKLVEVTK